MSPSFKFWQKKQQLKFGKENAKITPKIKESEVSKFLSPSPVGKFEPNLRNQPQLRVTPFEPSGNRKPIIIYRR